MEKKCSIDGCNEPIIAKGLCSRHYSRQRRGESDMKPEYLSGWKPNDPRAKNKGKICIRPDCNIRVYAKGLCRTHYNLEKRTGSIISPQDIWVKCAVKGCNERAIIGRDQNLKGYCRFHSWRIEHGIPLSRRKGVKGPLNHWWKGGVAEYPNHSEMKRMRKIVLKEANYICEYCGKPANQIHHKDLSRDNHSKENLVACCQSCNLKRGTSKFKRLYGKSSIELAKELGVSPTTISVRFKKYGNIDPPKIVSHTKLSPPHTSKFIRLYGKTLKRLAMDMNISIATVSKLHTQNRLLFTTESITCA